ncbi:hypothetical protein VSU16_03315 [Cetobacterium somerae]|uniref:hypothetical protein n=1 Tax=Cetobacterium somerae TaxID=188913 RepID=UPI002E7B3303|nr:hypothetical protein [Cetobacterium somerae]WVJ01770.1 hypothetical protein VSU16_03315 [Cetobacterium somerae]
MSWKCKKCGCSNFKETQIEETITTGIEFDKDGYKTMNYENEKTDSHITEDLECANCGNSASIFGAIEDIAGWEEK